MQLECELCGAHYGADIADAHVEGGRLTFTCKSCGREVVVIGGPGDRSPRAGALLPDLSDGPFDPGPAPGEGLSGGDRGAFPAPVPAAETAIPDPPLPEAPPPSREPSPRAVAAPAPEPAFAAPEKRGSGLLLVAAGLVVLVVGGGIVFLGPMLTGGKDERPPGPAARPAGPSSVPSSAAPLPSPTAAAAPTPEPAPVVEVRELRPAEAKPTAVPTPKKETVRDARTVFEAAAIDEALIRARPFYRLCAVGETKRNPDSKLGTVQATLTIAPSGSVTKVSLDRADLASSPLGQCVRDALAKLTFPAFEGSPAVLKVTIDLEVQTAR